MKAIRAQLMSLMMALLAAICVLATLVEPVSSAEGRELRFIACALFYVALSGFWIAANVARRDEL